MHLFPRRTADPVRRVGFVRFGTGGSIATRNAGADVLQPIAENMPFYLSGSADLHGSNKNYMKNVGDFSKNNYAGRNFYYGIREVNK